MTGIATYNHPKLLPLCLAILRSVCVETLLACSLWAVPCSLWAVLNSRVVSFPDLSSSAYIASHSIHYWKRSALGLVWVLDCRQYCIGSKWCVRTHDIYSLHCSCSDLSPLVFVQPWSGLTASMCHNIHISLLLQPEEHSRILIPELCRYVRATSGSDHPGKSMVTMVGEIIISVLPPSPFSPSTHRAVGSKKNPVRPIL